MKWIKFILGICRHDWEIISKHPLFHNDSEQGRPYGYLYVQNCKKCGKIKSKSI
jgi:hypothetical protein